MTLADAVPVTTGFSLGEVVTWPQAIVALAIILTMFAIPQTLSYLSSRQTNRQMKNNGGSTVKDSIDRIERKVDSMGDRLDAHIETSRKTGESTMKRFTETEERLDQVEAEKRRQNGAQPRLKAVPRRR